MNGTLRPSVGRAITLRLFGASVGVVYFMMAIGLAVCGINWLADASRDPVPKPPPGVTTGSSGATGGQQAQGQAHKEPGSDADSMPKAPIERLPLKPVTSVEKLAQMAAQKASDDAEAAQTKGGPVFWIIAHLKAGRLSGGAGPAQWDSVEKCISDLRANNQLDHLNIRIGRTIHHLENGSWTVEEGKWPKATETDDDESNLLLLAMDIEDPDIRTQALTMLLDAGADPNIPIGASGITPLMKAADKKYVNVINLLLANKADPEVKDASGTTAWDHATDSSIQALLKK